MAELFGWAALLRLPSSPFCPGHLRYAPCRHRHACHDITPTCFRDMEMMKPRVDLPGYYRNVAWQLIPLRDPGVPWGLCNASVPRSTRTQPPIHQLGHIIGASPHIG